MSWSESSIGENCLVGDGAHAKIQRQSTGIQYFTSKNIKTGKLDLTNVDFISNEDFEKHCQNNKKSIKRPIKNDVLVCIIGASVGDSCFVSEDPNAGLSSSVALLRAKTETLNPKYLYYWTRGHFFQDAIRRIKSGAAQSYLSQAMIKALPIKHPELSLQQEIADILSNYDDLIENNRRRIQLLEQSARLLYKEWFVHLRFPGHEHVEVVDGVPKDWTLGKISDFYKTTSGGTPSRKKPEFFNGDVLWIKTKELNNLFILSSEEKITEEAIQNSSAKILPAKTVLVAMYGATIGQVGILARPAATNQACCALIPKHESASYTHSFLFLREHKQQLINLSQGAAQNNISQTIIKSFPMVMPRKLLMLEFVDSVTPIFDQIHNLQQQTDKLQQARDLLLPRLMNGEITL